MQTQARRGDRSSLLHSYIGCYRLCMRRFMSSGCSPEISSAFPAPLTPRSAPGVRTSTISEALARATILRAFRLLEEVAMNNGHPRDTRRQSGGWSPLRSRSPGQRCNVLAAILGKLGQAFESASSPPQPRPIRQGCQSPLLLEHRKQHGGNYTMDVEISP
jgi:hypothetical protein